MLSNSDGRSRKDCIVGRSGKSKSACTLIGKVLKITLSNPTLAIWLYSDQNSAVFREFNM
jgi:hypothetical protein